MYDLFSQPPDFTIPRNKNGGQKSLDENRLHFSAQAQSVLDTMMMGQKVSSEWGITKVPRILDVRARIFSLRKAGLHISEETTEGAHGAKRWYCTPEQIEFNKQLLK